MLYNFTKGFFTNRVLASTVQLGISFNVSSVSCKVKLNFWTQKT